MGIYDDNMYSAEVRRWVDGDTVALYVDLGQGHIAKGKYRLSSIDAPETALRAGVTDAEKKAGLALKARMNEMWPRGTTVHVATQKSSGKYGRYLVTVFADLKGETVNVNQWLLDEGLAEAY